MSDEQSVGRIGASGVKPAEAENQSDRVGKEEDPATTMAPPEKEGPTVSAEMQVLIGRQLRAVYDDIATQPVPNRFVELLMQLDSKLA